MVFYYSMKLREISAREIMSTKLTTVYPNEKISAVEIKMIKKKVGGLPVIDKNTEKLIGIITQRDIQLSKSLIGEGVFKADDLMSKNPVYCNPDAKLPEIVKKMTDNDIERIPIIDDKRNVIGIIVQGDVIDALALHFEE